MPPATSHPLVGIASGLLLPGMIFVLATAPVGDLARASGLPERSRGTKWSAPKPASPPGSRAPAEAAVKRSPGWPFARKTPSPPPATTGPASQVELKRAVLARWNGSNSRLVVDVGRQKAFLLVDGKTALITPVSTARAGKFTPRGTFTMTERVRSGKISNLYHVSMPYWMRLGSTPYGAHAGYVPGYPASAGCIRLPATAAELIFNHTKAGTPVSIHNSWNGS